ncbi:uncharacterized protein LOC129903520 [Solanum dulcamara]|uniref:uncharacterized protein LOC129903520 n=1 Tax=Solanum dulcamara TaxID=45834 RepID=UPI002485BE79|nr:uncharacterized protein LOC129903520 [Solanum dulcamara]
MATKVFGISELSTQCFWRDNYQGIVIANDDQQLTINLKKNGGTTDLFVTAIYAKCTANERKDLWQSLENLNPFIDGPWCIGANFNVILDPEEKLAGNAIWILSIKLSQLSKNSIGDVYEQVNDWENKVQIRKEMDLNNNDFQSMEDLNKTQAESMKWLTMQESLLKQKSQINWFEEGDLNTRYFHNTIKDRKRKLHLHRIKNHRGRWIQGDDKIGRAAVRHFKKFFNLKKATVNNKILDHTPNVINNEDNTLLVSILNEEEIKNTIFNMSVHSTAGPDGYNGAFYQSCWHIIKEDVIAFV